MYCYEDRIRAVELRIKLGKRVRPTIRQLGYPTKNSLKGWYNEYQLKLDLSAGYAGRDRSVVHSDRGGHHESPLKRPDFFGRVRRSPSKRWIVGCNDSDGAGRGGFREGGHGRVVLVDHSSDRLMHELHCFARPMDAAACDAGNYIVQDGVRFGPARRCGRH
ncbi:hypothetical protein AcdelDRAFT_1503 [Acidovorax delafieldii 2AN]|uniref:Integrase catalytic region n=1 Tax=Acidovorax delafieldii 2AN TaxID=573060 RepID=C5T3M0_ACIDE|nr:hypothetical protein [Acidovorax delafieldii]EER60926.1 hypothetical protein AcdelDRAFT_1503 [Acidovorax delafieldii 2AN]